MNCRMTLIRSAGGLLCSAVLMSLLQTGCATEKQEEPPPRKVILTEEMLIKMTPEELDEFLKTHQMQNPEKSAVQKVDWSKRHSVEKRERLTDTTRRLEPKGNDVFFWRGGSSGTRSETLRDREDVFYNW